MKAWRGPQGIRLRLTLWYSAGMAASLLVFAAAAFWLIQREIEQRADRLLDEAARAFGNELVLEYQMLGTRDKAIDESLRGVRFRGVVLGVMDRSETGTLHASASLAGEKAGASNDQQHIRDHLLTELPALRLALSRGEEFVTLPSEQDGIRACLHRVMLGDGAPAVVVAARDRGADRETLENVGLAFFALVVTSILVAAAAGYALARKTLAPISAFGQQAQSISAADLSARVPIANPRDELGALGGVINDLLHRLEGAFTQQRQFMADASHELRTPLAIVRNEANIALSMPERAANEYRDALRIVERESERLSTLVEDLFLMARADGGGQPLRPEQLYLDDMLRDVVHATRTLADLRQVTVTVEAPPDAEYRGDEGLLRRAVVNLVDNAIKHTREGKRVHVQLGFARSRWEIRVTDEGAGISSDQRPHLFDRFHTGASTRSGVAAKRTSGTGLGLSIARWIAEAHGGTLELELSSPGGSTFLLALPTATR
ncbi:MAG: ATP-binding protein [Gemmatimonadaceae bacterium]